MSTTMSNLSHLPHDVLVVIAKQLKKLEDFVSFRCVSKSLLAAAQDEYFEGLRLRQRTPYLMLAVRDGNDDVRELYSLVEGESIVASLKVAKFNTKKCFESLGWLLVVEEDCSMSLLEPFSGTEIPLPHQNTFPEYQKIEMDAHIFIQKMVLSSRPNEASDFVLMVIAGGPAQLGFWRFGDKAWNIIEDKRDWRFTDVVYHGNGNFYAIGNPGIVWVFNFAGNDNDPKGRIIIDCDPIVPDSSSMDPPPLDNPKNYYRYGSKNLYILKTIDDALFIITRMAPNLSEDCLSYITTKFLVYEVDIASSTWKEIYSLGNMAVIVGHNSTIAVDASSSPGGVIKPNHIYFTDDDWEFYNIRSAGGMDIGVYNLETRTVEPIYPGKPLLSKVSTSVWINPCIYGFILQKWIALFMLMGLELHRCTVFKNKLFSGQFDLI